MAAAKGLAWGAELPCYGVSTLESMALALGAYQGYVCPVMGARRNQVYNALFKVANGEIKRLCEDRALLCDELANEIKELSDSTEKNIIVVGDGTDIFYPFVEDLVSVKKSASQRRYQNAVGVGFCSIEDFETGNTIKPVDLLPFYLRLPQAERELKAKEDKK